MAVQPTGAERAYTTIRDLVIRGAFEAGARLKEEELAATIGVSRTPIREALRRLSAEGLVEFIPNRGAHVASWSDDDLDEIFALRAAVEGVGCRFAAARITDGELEELRKLAQKMIETRQAGGSAGSDAPDIQMLNTEFHRLIMVSSRSSRLVEIATSLMSIPLIHRTFRTYTPEQMRRSLEGHLEIVDALAARDAAWAEATMHAHLLSARRSLAQHQAARTDTGDKVT